MKFQKPSFFSDKHKYNVLFEGMNIDLVSVTQVLYRLYNFDNIPDAYLELARERGSAVHRACEFEDYGVLNESGLDPRLVPYVNAWKQFKFDTGFEVLDDADGLLIERPLCDPWQRLAGTPDVIGRCMKLSGKPQTVVDRKATYTISPVAALQLAGYQHLLESNEYPVQLRYVVQLLPDGKPKLFPFTDFVDKAVFLSEMTSFKWRQKYLKERIDSNDK